MEEVEYVDVEYREEEFTETVEVIEEDPEIDAQIEDLRNQRADLEQQIRDIDKQIDELMAKKIRTEEQKAKKTVAVLKCPRCSIENKLVISSPEEEIKIKVRCPCGTILAAR